MHYRNVQVSSGQNAFSGLWEATITAEGSVIARNNELGSEEQAVAWVRRSLNQWMQEQASLGRLIERVREGLWYLSIVFYSVQIYAAIEFLLGDLHQITAIVVAAFLIVTVFLTSHLADLWVPWLRRLSGKG